MGQDSFQLHQQHFTLQYWISIQEICCGPKAQARPAHLHHSQQVQEGGEGYPKGEADEAEGLEDGWTIDLHVRHKEKYEGIFL